MIRANGMPPTHDHPSRRTILASGAAVAASLSLSANSTTYAAKPREIRVNSIQTVSPVGSKFLEPWIAAHPSDPSRLVILASRYLGKGPGALHTDPVAWFTADGGSTW